MCVARHLITFFFGAKEFLVVGGAVAREPAFVEHADMACVG